MPFINQVVKYIDDALKAGSLNNKKLQPLTQHGVSTVVARKKAGSKDLELLPGIVTSAGIASVITPESKTALQVYHKAIPTTYNLDKKGYGDKHFMNSSTEVIMVVINNIKLTGKSNEMLEPVMVYGVPQKLSSSLMMERKINNCLITVLSSNMDHVALFRQEYPQSEYFLNEGVSMFSIRYRVTMQFSQGCIDACLCE